MKKRLSLKWQMLGIILLCWLIPVVLVLGVMGWYISDSLSQRAIDNLDSQFSVNLQMCRDRLQSAVGASRSASSDPTIKTAWAKYQKGGYYLSMNISTRAFMDREYRTDPGFRFATLWLSDAPAEHRLSVHNESLGATYREVRSFWEEDQRAVQSLAAGLGTDLAFFSQSGQLYLVRNVMNSDYRPIGVLTLCLNVPYYFDNLVVLPWASSITASVDGVTLHLTDGDADTTGGPVVVSVSEGRDFTLAAHASVDYDVLLSQISSYTYLLAGMGILLIPLLFAALYFFNNRISTPIDTMMSAAGEIERGALGYHLDYTANSREFQYLTDSFNHMSAELQSQFDHIYQEELALRDARIKALQSHINPHFLNNTLEIINWEARMSGDVRVSKMIESLSTVLDAAIARDSRPEVTLGEEMGYVNAYLHIITERFGKRITITQDIATATLGRMVPRLILQPVIENAVEHGVGPAGVGTVSIRGFLEGATLILEIINDGALSAADRAQVARLLEPERDNSGETAGNIGISNVHQRLRILCGPGSGLTLTDDGRGRVVARLTISPKPEL